MPILATKLRNAIKRLPFGDKCVFTLKNIIINGEKRGCSGFVSLGNRHVYVSTEECAYSPFSDTCMYRVATDTKDFSGKGGYNQWCIANPDVLAQCIMRCFERRP